MNHPEVIIVPSLFFMIGYIVWVVVTASQRKHRLRLVTEFHSKLLDKLGSVKDFGEFLQTEAGARFMKELAAEPITVGGPHERILRAAQLGVVLVCLGFGLPSISFFWAPGAAESGQNAFAAMGAISVSLGFGFIASTIASYRLAGALGLMPRRDESSSAPAASQV